MENVTKEDEVNALADHREYLKDLGMIIHHDNAKWWVDIKHGAAQGTQCGELLMLTVSELAEGMEGDRKNLMDDKLPHRSMLEVELADAIIRILDIGAGKGLDVAGALVEKLVYTAHREDHKLEHRKGEHGKKY